MIARDLDPSRPLEPETLPAIVIGAGPGGLAAAAALRAHGIRALVLDRAPHVGHSWRGHYDRLHLHTPRELSHLPGYRIPRRMGRWVSRDDVVAYLEEYAAHHELDLLLGVAVTSLRRDGDGWRVELADGSARHTPHVIVATGYNNTPVETTWPGAASFTGELVPSSGYRSGSSYAGRDVLVVGAGNTGAEIAVDLVEQGAARVRWAVRTVPHILRRSTLGWSAQSTGILVRRLPVRLVDALSGPLGRLSVPDLSKQGLPRPTTGLYSQVNRGRIPIQDVGIVAAVRAGTVEVVAGVAGMEGPDVLLTDGSRIAPEVVVVATGYRQNLEPLLGGLGVLDSRGLPTVHGAHTDAAAPGLWFTGFTNPISGMFRELARDATAIAAAIAAAARRE